MKRKKGTLVMVTFPRFKPVDELKHWRYCDGCGKRFSELDMVWIDTQSWFCGKCQARL